MDEVPCHATSIRPLVHGAAGRIAAASLVAFVAAATVDLAVYRLLRRRGVAFMERATWSNTAGAGVDSVLFPALAFGFPVLWLIAAGQFAAKVGGGAFFAAVIASARNRRAEA